MRASDRAYRTLREDILEGALEPGTVLGEIEQSARLGISRTPLREALGRLVADGLAAPSAGRGMVVTAASLADAGKLFDLRIALEVLAVRRAAETSADDPAAHDRFADLAGTFDRAISPLSQGADPTDYYALTQELDLAVDSSCGNAYLADSLRGVRVHLARLRRLSRHSPARLAETAREHAAIARAIADGNPELAAAATVVHLQQALAHLRTDPDSTTPPTRRRHRPRPELYRAVEGDHRMRNHDVRTHRSDENLARPDQLAWAMAEVATDPVEVETEVQEMIINRVIDNASVAVASLNRAPIVSARSQALSHPVASGGSGASVVGIAEKSSPEWAAWANGVAVRELDYHDTFLAAEYSHPGDNIPPILAVGEHAGSSGHDLVRAIATGYELQVDLVRAISLHAHKIDHVAHLGPSAAAGIGTLLGLDTETVFQAIGQALHTTTATRQSRKGEISTWKAHAPAFAGKMAVESVDRAMRGQTSPVPIYEGEDGVIAWLLDGPDARYTVPLPAPGEAKRAILDTYTKEHSAEYQAQAWIDLARRLHTEHPEAGDPEKVDSILIRTSHHTHFVIGSGANDPQKYEPTASRETLDHSIPYIVAVALQDGTWHHEHSYAPERAGRRDTVALWHKVTTQEDPEWTRRYHSLDLQEKAFGGDVRITLTDGTVIEDSIAVADAHPLGARPFARAQYVEKFRSLADGLVDDAEIDRFLETAANLPDLAAGELGQLNVRAAAGIVDLATGPKGLF